MESSPPCSGSTIVHLPGPISSSANRIRRGKAHPADSAATFPGFRPLTIAELYGFPPGDGTGQTVGIIELGGGFRPGDLQTYFNGIGITTPPTVLAFSVDNATNSPGTLQHPDPSNGEVMLDIEVIGAIVPKATIVVYFSPNLTDANFSDAILAAVHDSVNKPSVISISWGGPEDEATGQFLDAFKTALEDAQSLNITVLVASGDNGAADMHARGSVPMGWQGACRFPRVQPAGAFVRRDPNRSLGHNAGRRSRVEPRVRGHGPRREQLRFRRRRHQRRLHPTTVVAGEPHLAPLGEPRRTAGRGVPDVTGNGDPGSGYNIRVDGEDAVIGGTSAVAPLWAGLIARINQTIGKPVGFVNATLYANPSAFNDITLGNNRVSSHGGSENLGYDATQGWDACTGLGSPNGNAVLAALQAATASRTDSGLPRDRIDLTGFRRLSSVANP